jgi:hypothetical protein
MRRFTGEPGFEPPDESMAIAPSSIPAALSGNRMIKMIE